VNVETLRFRMTALGVVVACLFGALFVRLWYLQVLDSSQFQVAAQQNGVQLVYTPAPRGRILDRNGKVIVDNQLINVLTANRAIVKKDPQVVHQLAVLLDESDVAVKHAIANNQYNDLAPVPIAQPTVDQMTYVKENSGQFPGVDVSQEVQRLYPNGSLAAHLLGYVGEINPTELAGHKGQGYRPGDQIGKSGVEQAYESQLRGIPGVTKIEVDSHGKVIGTLGSQPPVPGHDLRLSIDLDVQNLAEDSLATGLANAQATIDRQKNSSLAGHFYPAPAGAVVVEDPRTGQILALASQPTYDPKAFVGGISTAAYQALTSKSNNDPLADRATSGLYAPGSTFKMVTATAALHAGLVTPGTPFVDRGFVKIGGQIFHNDGGNVYGTVNLQRAITVSSDAYFYTLGADFWQNGRSLALQATAHDYGFGAHSGIAIGDYAGKVPDPTTRREEYQAAPAAFPGGPNWFTGDNVNLAIGQGELVVTPLQLANAYAAFADGGTLYQPQIALDAEQAGGAKLQSYAAKVVRQIPLAPDQRAAMLAGFEGVISDGGGTAHGAFAGFPLSQVSVAGKTGTAQVDGKEPTSVFTAWAPAVNPDYEVTVFEEQAGYGASASAPVVRRIIEGLFGMPTPPPVYIQNAAAN
jgi:penicillin-binding protein 2